MPQPDDTHYDLILNVIRKGKLIPFLGAGVNLCDRPQGMSWAQQPDDYLPSGAELAQHLADDVSYRGDNKRDLLRTSQYVAAALGSAHLYDSLRDVFNENRPPTSAHRFLARLPKVLHGKGYPVDYPLIVTTNYDDLMERAFEEIDQPYDVVSYMAEGDDRGKFLHWPAAGTTAVGSSLDEPTVIDVPNQYGGLSLKERPVVFKIHGAIDRSVGGEWDSYVITEDHYIDYLARIDPASLIPATLLAKLRRNHFLFLGYSLSDWNLRVILHRIWGEQKLSWQSWAVQLDPDSLEQEFWDQRGVAILNLPLNEYVSALSERLANWPPAGGAA